MDYVWRSRINSDETKLRVFLTEDATTNQILFFTVLAPGVTGGKPGVFGPFRALGDLGILGDLGDP